MYRPEGFSGDLHKRYSALVKSEGKGLSAKPYALMEAGADAMLEGLIEDMRDFGTHHTMQIFMEKILEAGVKDADKTS